MGSNTSGRLVVVGTGIKLVSQLTIEAKGHIEQADKVYYLLTGKLAAEWIHTLNPNAESLTPHYQPERLRLKSYQAMTVQIVTAVLAGHRVCAVFYGHPGVFVLPAHEAMRQVRAAGLLAIMLPGISAEDCLFADVGVDPAVSGCQSFEATDFLLYKRPFSATSHLILWQIGVIGDLYEQTPANRLQQRKIALTLLREKLTSQYPPSHQVVIYQAPQLPTQDPLITHSSLQNLADIELTRISTLYVPPLRSPLIDEDIATQLGIKKSDLIKRW